MKQHKIDSELRDKIVSWLTREDHRITKAISLTKKKKKKQWKK